MVEQVVELLCEIRPEIVITQRPQHETRHRLALPDDHFTCAQIVHEAIGLARIPQAGAERVPHEVVQVYYTGVDSSWTEIDLFVDIADQFEKRVQAEMIFCSQGHTPEKSRRRIELATGSYGWTAKLAYAEPFIRARGEIGDYLTLDEKQRAIAGERHLEQEKRMGKSSGG